MKEEARQKIKELIERFRYNLDVYKRSTYNEAQVRREFIDPFFEALGWDVSNRQGHAEQYKEVIHEDSIKVGHSTRAPDYSFRIGGQRKFFVEAKKPAVDIKGDVTPSYQLRRYAWSAKLPLSILTDFEELSVFDCRVKPKPNDKPDVARIKYFTFTQYLDRFDEIYEVFSKEAIFKGSFDRYAQATKGKKGTAEVDTEFLKEIESWRELLAKNIALRNPELSIYELNYAVQKIIDRIIFMRICEDRGIEPYGQLQTKAESGGVYKHLLNHFKLAESKYNSGIFDFDADKITPALQIDDKVLKTIIQHLYYPESPYEFSVLGVEILGNVYEQFLGKVIRLTAGHQAKVETKPEVKKAGGVYYTPQYIVDYIVKNTVGKLIEGKTPDEITGIKILDPACGSGSFLIGTYTYLLKYHLDWYTSNKPKQYKKAVFQVRENEWYLTTAEKKRILLNNIFGVDIDPQAVEVTKLSLLLKVLEHESRESIDQQVKLGLEGVLPNLEDNIKCGNSLIGPDFYDTQQTTLFDEAEMRRINVFDWNDYVKGFGKIMKRGGFDVVIGNPPWGSLLTESEKEYLYHCYVNRRGEAESHLFFTERGFRLLNHSGILGFITPNTWLSVLNSREIRGYLLENATFCEICELSKYIFKEAPDIVPILIFLGKKGDRQPSCVVKRANVIRIHASNFNEVFSINRIPQHIWQETQGTVINLHLTRDVLQVIGRCNANAITLSEICDVLYGIKTGDNKKYLSNTRSEKHKVKALKTGELVRYHIEWNGVYLWWCSELAGYRTSLLEVPKIIVQYIRKLSLPKRIIAASDDDGEYYPLNNYSYISPKNSPYSLKYVLGLINSELLNFYFANTFIDYNIKPTYLKQLPIRTIDFSNPTEKAQHDKLVALVENMLELQKKYHDARMERDKELYERQIKVVDKQIDKLVYGLYGLTEEEIKVVEGE